MELLIVIAIIGILASVIISSLNDARQQGINTKIKSEMDSIAKRGAIEESQSASFDTVCGSNSAIQSSVVVALINSIETLSVGVVTCNSDRTEYAVSVPLDTVHWCVDSTGARKEIPNALTAGQLACP